MNAGWRGPTYLTDEELAELEVTPELGTEFVTDRIELVTGRYQIVGRSTHWLVVPSARGWVPTWTTDIEENG